MCECASVCTSSPLSALVVSSDASFVAVGSNRVMSRELSNTVLPFQCSEEPRCLSPLGAAVLPLAGIWSKPQHIAKDGCLPDQRHVPASLGIDYVL